MGGPAKVTVQFKKRDGKLLFFFSPTSHSAEAPARREMTAVIKLIESERQALLSP